MDNVTQLPVPRLDLPRSLRPDVTPELVGSLVDRVERLLDLTELGLSFHDRLLQFRNAVQYQAYGRRGWAELVRRLDDIVERSAVVHSLLMRAHRSH
jgi:hypothetical protein